MNIFFIWRGGGTINEIPRDIWVQNIICSTVRRIISTNYRHECNQLEFGSSHSKKNKKTAGGVL